MTDCVWRNPVAYLYKEKEKKCVRSFGRLFSEIAQPLGVESDVLCCACAFFIFLFLASRHGRFIAFKILPVTASSTFDYFLDDAFADDEKAILKNLTTSSSSSSSA